MLIYFLIFIIKVIRTFLPDSLVFKIINLGHELHLIFYLLPITYYPLPITYYSLPIPIPSCHVFKIITSPTVS
jgi:hypothetical protein